MKTDNIIVDKSFDFAVRIVNLYKYMKNTKNEYVLSKQILRSGTSVGANINEAICGISKKDFLSKMEIEYNSILEEANEISKILSSITKTTRIGINS